MGSNGKNSFTSLAEDKTVSQRDISMRERLERVESELENIKSRLTNVETNTNQTDSCIDQKNGSSWIKRVFSRLCHSDRHYPGF